MMGLFALGLLIVGAVLGILAFLFICSLSRSRRGTPAAGAVRPEPVRPHSIRPLLCSSGHLLTPDNRYIYPERVLCRTCDRERRQAKKSRARGATA